MFDELIIKHIGDKWISVVPLTFGRGRIIVTDGASVFDSW